MRVIKLRHTPLGVAVVAIRECYDSMDQSDSGPMVQAIDFLNDKDLALIERVIQSGHHSTLEHIVYTFKIEGISRGCLQELARHRIASLSVQSTRYCLRKLLNGAHPSELLVSTGDGRLDFSNELQLASVQKALTRGLRNDQVKTSIPEAFKTSLVWTINARSLRNFLKLRLSKRAHPEIRKLAREVLVAVPVSHDVLFRDTIQED